MAVVDFSELRQLVTPALISKKEEFILLGYHDISMEELWTFFVKKKWKKLKKGLKLHEAINDILRLNVSEYISYATIEAFKLPDLSLVKNKLTQFNNQGKIN